MSTATTFHLVASLPEGLQPQHVYPHGGTPHELVGTSCWCAPVRSCASCGALGPCDDGEDRADIIVHGEAA